MEGECSARPTWHDRVPWGFGLNGDPIPDFPVSAQALLESNEPPSTDALYFVTDYRSDAQATLQTTRQLRCADKIHDEELLFEKCIHLCNVILSPLRRIPNEIIQEILDFAMQDWRPFCYPLNSICSRWRMILQSMSRSRANICLAVKSTSFHDTLRELGKAVRNTSDYPLWIRLTDADTPQPSPWNGFFQNRSIMERVTCLWITTKDLPLPESVEDSHYATLTRLQTLVLREAAWTKEFVIDFKDEFMSNYPVRDLRLPELLAGSQRLRRVSLGQLSTKSINSIYKTTFWDNLTHIFLQPTFSVYGWRMLIRQCNSLIVGYFYITQIWHEHDGRNSPPDNFTCNVVQDLTIVLVDFVDDNSLNALGSLNFPNLTSFAVHVNKDWHTDFEARDLTKNMPVLRKLSIPHTWNMRKREEYNFIDSFPSLADLEVGVTVTQTVRMLEFLTIPDHREMGEANVAHQREAEQEGAGDAEEAVDEESDEEDEESDADDDQSDNGESESDDIEIKIPKIKRKPKLSRKCRSKVLQAVTIEVYDHYEKEDLTMEHGKAFVRMVQSRFRSPEPSSSTASSPLRLACIRLLRSSTKQEQLAQQKQTDAIFAYIHRALNPLVEHGLQLETVFASQSLSSYAEKWDYALSRYDSS